MLELKDYTTKELQEALEIADWEWKKKKQQILQQLQYCCHYETYMRGVQKFYHIIEIYSDWEGLVNKKNRQEIKAYYSERAEEIISKDKYTTGSQLARDVRKRKDFIFPHKEGTSAVYCREVLKEEYDIVDREWRRVDIEGKMYIPLTKDQLDYLKLCFKEKFSNEDNIERKTNLINDFKNKVISNEEFKEELCSIEIMAYDEAIVAFVTKYGFQPRKIPGWEKKNWGA